MAVSWNPWHGCHKISPGCVYCYVHRADSRHGRDGSAVFRTKAFALPVSRDGKGRYRVPSGSRVDLCFTSDFLLEDADPWRPEAWRMIRCRQDLSFLFITKRIHRLAACVPEDWGEGYPNVTVGCTVENQQMADYRLPLFLHTPAAHKLIICSPLLEALDLTPYLGRWVEQVTAGGEAGPDARICRFEWVQSLHRQCQAAGVGFSFRQTGARLVKDNVLYRIPKREQMRQARRSGLDWNPPLR